jgi:hypothetical protein
MTAYVLIQKRADTKPVAGTIRAKRGVVEAEDLTGAYDAIALAEAESARDLFERVLPEIRRVDGVTQALAAPLTWRPVTEVAA